MSKAVKESDMKNEPAAATDGLASGPEFVRTLQSLVDSTPALIHTGLPNGDLDFFNRTWLEYVGLPMEDLLGWKWTASIHPEDLTAITEKWRASVASGQPFCTRRASAGRMESTAGCCTTKLLCVMSAG